ncbi:MAG: tyrosine-type recombinase/integrase [Desulfobacterales bacterium]|nr:tyrosine-type recombinase/integrase [Desulfobacterales bacterium]
MIDDKTISAIEWIEKRLKEIESAVKDLDQAIKDYLQWIAENGYKKSTQKEYARRLKQFRLFIKQKKCTFEKIFTDDTFRQFEKLTSSGMFAIYGLSRYLFDHKRIARPLSPKDPPVDLPKIYEDYIFYHQQHRQRTGSNNRRIRRVLWAFHEYLQKEKIDLARLAIEHVDAFLAQFLAPFKPDTRRVYRSSLRGFLTYLYQDCNLIKRDLASFIVGTRHYGLAIPPKFLRPKEIKELFAGFTLDSDSDIRTYAMVHLAYTLGLRPKEITLIARDDICFSTAELTVTDRKNEQPITLPIPDATLKALAAYRIAGRPESKHSAFFLTLKPPYRPANPNTIGYHIRKAMKTAGLPSTAYWLRHTYAQNLLESGDSVFEIKEMLGHDDIESTRKYLHVHTKLMRQVLFDETL